MKLCRFGDNRLGLVTGDAVRDVTPALDVLPAARYPYPHGDALIANLPKLVARIGEIAGHAPTLALRDCRLLAPVANPGKIIAAPVNYKKHLDEARADPELHHQNQVAEIQRVGLFLKATSSVIGADDDIVIRHPDRRTDHEIELAAVIGRTASKVTRDEALDYIVGYCIGLDITVRGPEERSLRKSIDTYTVLGPWLMTADEVGNASALDLELAVNGEPRQQANTRDLVIGIADLIVFASAYYTLHPGDVILTGTPDGVGPIKPGDTIDAQISKIGAMQVKVR